MGISWKVANSLSIDLVDYDGLWRLFGVFFYFGEWRPKRHESARDGREAAIALLKIVNCEGILLGLGCCFFLLGAAA